eukprot:403340640
MEETQISMRAASSEIAQSIDGLRISQNGNQLYFQGLTQLFQGIVSTLPSYLDNIHESYLKKFQEELQKINQEKK